MHYYQQRLIEEAKKYASQPEPTVVSEGSTTTIGSIRFERHDSKTFKGWSIDTPLGRFGVVEEALKKNTTSSWGPTFKVYETFANGTGEKCVLQMWSSKFPPSSSKGEGGVDNMVYGGGSSVALKMIAAWLQKNYPSFMVAEGVGSDRFLPLKDGGKYKIADLFVTVMGKAKKWSRADGSNSGVSYLVTFPHPRNARKTVSGDLLMYADGGFKVVPIFGDLGAIVDGNGGFETAKPTSNYSKFLSMAESVETEADTISEVVDPNRIVELLRANRKKWERSLEKARLEENEEDEKFCDQMIDSYEEMESAVKTSTLPQLRKLASTFRSEAQQEIRQVLQRAFTKSEQVTESALGHVMAVRLHKCGQKHRNAIKSAIHDLNGVEISTSQGVSEQFYDIRIALNHLHAALSNHESFVASDHKAAQETETHFDLAFWSVRDFLKETKPNTSADDPKTKTLYAIAARIEKFLVEMKNCTKSMRVESVEGADALNEDSRQILSELNLKDEAVRIRSELKKAFPAHKFTVRTSFYSMGQSLTVTLRSGPTAFAYENGVPSQDAQINHYHSKSFYGDDAGKFIDKVVAIINKNNWNRSDPQTDYFDVGFYFHIEQGSPFVLTDKTGKKALDPKAKVPVAEAKAKPPLTHFKSYTSAVAYAREMAEMRGYEIDEDSWQSRITHGFPARPSEGSTTTKKIDLLKGGKPVKEQLYISVYGMKTGYELTTYITK
jgi:hypothetical protein